MSADHDLAARVSLSPFTPADIGDAYLGWLNDAEVMRHTEARHYAHTPDSAAAYVAGHDGIGSALFRILLDGRHVGNVRLSTRSEHNRRCDIAILLGDKSVWGRGIGSIAIRQATQWAFEQWQVEKVTAYIYAGHGASRRAFEKAGFAHEATLRRHVLLDGQWIDLDVLCCFRGTP